MSMGAVDVLACAVAAACIANFVPRLACPGSRWFYLPASRGFVVTAGASAVALGILAGLAALRRVPLAIGVLAMLAFLLVLSLASLWSRLEWRSGPSTERARGTSGRGELAASLALLASFVAWIVLYVTGVEGHRGAGLPEAASMPTSRAWVASAQSRTSRPHDPDLMAPPDAIEILGVWGEAGWSFGAAGRPLRNLCRPSPTSRSACRG